MFNREVNNVFLDTCDCAKFKIFNKFKNILPIFFILFAILPTVGCSPRATLNISSNPDGAQLVHIGSNAMLGNGTYSGQFDSALLKQHRAPDGCYLVGGIEARWISGAVTQINPIRLCGSAQGTYNIVFSRDPSVAGYDKDMQFALEVQRTRLLAAQTQAAQRQAAASEDAAAAALYRNIMNSRSVDCQTTKSIYSSRTTCR
ncbi:MAG: hypothetical protein NTY94_15560 [Alphaproteobacteria bacterium]|jgi:hypothetical protein|nr:hypothetical protein [Alphaproteobacteria bacterium]